MVRFRIAAVVAGISIALAITATVVAANANVGMTEASDRYTITPAKAFVNVGGTVTWTNTTDADHTVKSDSGSELASSTVAQNATFNHTLNAVGTFTSRCTVHTYMKGTIEVLAAGAALPSTDTVAPAAGSAAHPSPFVLAALPMFATALVIEFYISRRRA